MPIITFLYLVGNNPTRHFGKYVSNRELPDFIGLDVVIRNALIRTLNIEQKVYGIGGAPYSEHDVDVGILSYTQDNAWTTYREVYLFDTYIEVSEKGKTRRWTMGDRLHKHAQHCCWSTKTGSVHYGIRGTSDHPDYW